MIDNRATRRREAALTRKTAANGARGETIIAVQTRDGEQEFKLCLTLSAIAEIEDGLGVENLQEIEGVLQSASSRHFATILAALARGGGHDITVDDIRKGWNISIHECLAGIVAAFKQAGAMSVAEDADAQSAGELKRGN